MSEEVRVNDQEREYERQRMTNCKECGHLTMPSKRLIEAGYFYHPECLITKRRKDLDAKAGNPWPEATYIPLSGVIEPEHECAPSPPSYYSGGGGDFGGGGASSSYSDSSSDSSSSD